VIDELAALTAYVTDRKLKDRMQCSPVLAPSLLRSSVASS